MRMAGSLFAIAIGLVEILKQLPSSLAAVAGSAAGVDPQRSILRESALGAQ